MNDGTAPDAKRRMALYRMFGEDGRLLYVGISGRLPARLAAHQSDKSWWSDVASITVEHIDDRDKAMEAEKAAIVAERPEHNVTHSVDVGRRRLPAAETSRRSPAVIGARGYRATYEDSSSQAIVGWDADGDALICALDGSLVKARDVEGFIEVFSDYTAAFIPSDGNWTIERPDGTLRPVIGWAISSTGSGLPIVMFEDGEAGAVVQADFMKGGIYHPKKTP